jgi:hypothetical protein
MLSKMDQRDLLLTETIAKLQTQLNSMTEEVSRLLYDRTRDYRLNSPEMFYRLHGRSGGVSSNWYYL